MYVCYSLSCFLAPCFLWILFHRKEWKGEPHVLKHLVWSFLYMLYLFLAIIDIAQIGTIWDLIHFGGLDDTINLIPFDSVGAMTYVLNVFMFMPFGFLLPLIWREYRKFGKVVLSGFTMSALIEFLQLFCHRVTDVDDLLMNTIGTMFGYYLWVLFHGYFPRAGEDAYTIRKGEPLFYLFAGVFCVVLFYNWRWLYMITKN